MKMLRHFTVSDWEQVPNIVLLEAGQGLDRLDWLDLTLAPVTLRTKPRTVQGI